jgi:hypothetical protein
MSTKNVSVLSDDTQLVMEWSPEYLIELMEKSQKGHENGKKGLRPEPKKG